MKLIGTICLLCALAASAIIRAADDSPAKARRLLLGGKYAEAAEIYAPLAKKNPAAALGLARCMAAGGKTDQAVRTLSAAAGPHAELHAELARLAFQRGDYKEAKTRARQAIKLDTNQLLARWILAELHRTAGRLEEAERGYRRLVTFYNDHEVKRAESLRWIGLAAARYARWNRLADQFSFLVNDLYPDALKLDPAYWPAHYEAGVLFLEKYNQAEAARHFQAALELNPNAAEVHVAMARLAVAARDIEKAEASIDRALGINPRLLCAWLGKADLAWANFKAHETLRLLQEKALPLNPISEQTLGRVAACYVLADGLRGQGRSSRFTRLRQQVTKRNAHAGEFFFALAACLEARNKMPEAETFFLEAIKRMPQKVGPRSHLGLLYMRWGEEAEARRWLDKALEVDPFNVRLSNTLSVLAVLDSMATLPTEQFILKFDGKHDKLLARYAARHLEAVYPKLCKQFGYRPPGKPLVEIFNRAGGHDGQKWFSTRMIGLPYLGTVAACTGRMVAVASPNDPQAARRFNWARVLKHELVHVITLQQTHFNIPHWYTEGLAVFSEGYPRPQLWNELLLERVPRGQLFNLQTINPAFTRPHSSRDWQMAYCQAELYVEYMLRRFGSGRQRKLLAAYAEGLTTREAIRRVFGVSQEEFEQGYLAQLKNLVSGLSSLKGPSRAGLAELLKAHRDRPKDADAAAELAYAYLRRSAATEALDLARLAVKLHPKHQLATYVLARLQVKAGRTPEAVELLEGCLDRSSPHPLALNLLAGLKLKVQHYDEAARLYALGERLDPINLKWTRALARVYLATENKEKLTRVLTRLARADADDLTVRKKLAQIALDQRDYTAAADWANQAIQIDVMDVHLHRVFAQALVGCHNYGQAIEEFEIAIELKPDQPFPRYALADACIQAGQPEKARKALEGLLELAPDYPGAEMMLENLGKTKPP